MPVVLDLMLRAAAIVAGAWILTAALRRRSASLRAMVWTAALAGLLILPAATWLMPAWRLGILPASPTVSAETPPSRAREADVVALAAEVVRVPTRVPAARVPDRLSSASAPSSRAAAATAPHVDWLWLALAAWMVVAIGFVVRLVLAHVRVRRLVGIVAATDADAAQPEWQALVDEQRRALSIRRRVTVHLTAAVDVPAVAGLRRPVLLLPPEAGQWAADVRRAVVLHELAHVIRRDGHAHAVGQLACAVYWFLPFVWLGARTAGALREQASDDLVLRAGVRPSSYAEALVGLAGMAAGRGLDRAALAMARPWRLRDRVTAILDPTRPRSRPGRAATAAVVAGAAVLVAAVATATPAARAASAPAARPAGVPVPPAGMAVPPAGVAVSPAGAVSSEPPAVPPSGAAQVAASIPCAGGLKSSSSSIHEDDGRREWTVKLRGGDCDVDLRAEGAVEFNDDFTDIAAIRPSGFFRLDATTNGMRRQLDIESRGGTLSRTWRVDGREAPYDAAARAWFAAFLIELDRRTAIGIDTRFPLLLRQGGVDAVLAETALMTGDYARHQYYTRIARQQSLTPQQAARLFAQAAPLTKSDYYASQLIEAFAGRVFDERAVRTGVLQLIDGMDSDFYRSASIAALVDGRRLGPDELDLLARVLGRMSSDHYKVETLTHLLEGGRIDAGTRTTLVRMSAGIDSGYYGAAFLEKLAGSGALDADERRAYLDGIDRLDGDHYRVEALTAFLRSQAAAESDLLAAVAVAGRIRSDHYASEALRAIARHEAVTERVRSAVLTAADRLSRHYADVVRREVRSGR